METNIFGDKIIYVPAENDTEEHKAKLKELALKEDLEERVYKMNELFLKNRWKRMGGN